MAVVLSRALVLSDPVGGESPNAPIIGWRNLVTLGGITADHVDTDFPASNLANPSTASRWESGSTATQYVTFVVAGTDEIDYVGIARHNLGSAGVNVSVETYDAIGDTWDEAFAAVVLAGDGPAILRFEPVNTTQVRIKLQPAGTAPRIAVVYIGKLLVLERGLQSGLVPLAFGASDEVVSGQAESGDFLGRVVTSQSIKTSVSIRYLRYDWFRENMGPFARAARTIPFFFSWAPEDYPDDAGYAWLDGDVRPTVERTAQGIMAHVDISLKALAL